MISIVANFYKSERHIDRLVDSVLAQTRQDWELVCINDCSPGRDSELLHRRAAAPEAEGRIRVIDLPENVGISRAKQRGIAEARGEWITFIDGDDRLRPRALEAMAGEAERLGADITIMNCRRVFDIPGTHVPLRTVALRSQADYGRLIERPEMVQTYLRAFFGHNILSSYAYWGKLYRHEVLERSEYEVPAETLYEDVFFVMHAMLAARSIAFTPYEGYDWRWGGLSSGSTLKEKSGVTDFKALRVARLFAGFYYPRIEIIERYGIPGAHGPLLTELRNVLYSSFSNSAAPAPGAPGYTRLLAEMESVTALPAYAELSTLTADNDPFLAAINRRDLPAAYAIAHAEYRSHRLKHLLKRILSC